MNLLATKRPSSSSPRRCEPGRDSRKKRPRLRPRPAPRPFVRTAIPVHLDHVRRCTPGRRSSPCSRVWIPFVATSELTGAGFISARAASDSPVSQSSSRALSMTTGIRSCTPATTRFGSVVMTENAGERTSDRRQLQKTAEKHQAVVGRMKPCRRTLVARPLVKPVGDDGAAIRGERFDEIVRSGGSRFEYSRGGGRHAVR